MYRNYKIHEAGGSSIYMRADMTQAGAGIYWAPDEGALAGDGGARWIPAPFETAHARHRIDWAADLLEDWLEIEGGGAAEVRCVEELPR